MLHKSVSDRKFFLIWMLLSMGLLVFFTAVSSFALSQTESSSKLITEAYKNGSIGTETYIIQKLQSHFSPNRVNPAFKSSLNNEPSREVTILLDYARRNYDYFSDESKIYLTMLLKRPVDPTYNWPWAPTPDFYLPAPVLTFEPTVADYPNIGGKIKFWYVTHATADGAGHVHTTTLDFVKKMAAAFETVYKTEITDMGYAAPPNDTGGADYGSDTKFDVYVMNSGFAGVYGYLSREELVSGNSYSSFMVMDNNFTEFVTATITAEEAMQVTAAHEYHHAVQNGINAFADAWYKEATATWMEDQVFDSVHDNLQYLNGTGANDFFYMPETSLDASSDHWYGAWIWNEFIETKWDQNAIKSVWDNLDAVGNDNAIDALVASLTSLSCSLKDAFTGFVAKNYSKAGFYKDALLYDDIKIVNKDTPHTLDFSKTDSHILTEQTPKVNHLASKYYKFVPGPTLVNPTQLTIKVDGPDLQDVNAIAIVKKKDGTFVEYPFALGATDKKGEIGISGFCTKEITEVVLALVNYSKSTDDLEIKYEASLLKGLVFCIDDTGSMGTNISYAKAAAITVLNDNKAAGRQYYYTLLSFKDGPATLRGQSSDEEIMKGYINALSAGGGAGCPESSLTAIRQAADISKGADIFMMTDASSNSYGVDNTYASWGEAFATIFKLLENKCHLHSIVYSTCTDAYRTGNGEVQCPGCYIDAFAIASLEGGSPSGVDGYNRASTETGGMYFRISSADTEAAVTVILREASSDSTICFYDGSLSGGNTTYNIPVDATIAQLQVALNGNVGSSLSLEVRNPAGIIVDKDTAGVSVILVGGSSFYLIQGAALSSGGGVWTANAGGSGSYRFSASCSTTNPMDYTGNTSVSVGGALSLKASVRQAVTGIGFQLVKIDGTNPIVLSLTSSDGLSYTGSQVMNTVGSYRFRATGDGNYQRMYSSKITVGNLDVVAPAAKNVTPGMSFTHQFKVKNLGTEEDTYNMYATSSLGWSDLTAVPSSIKIPAGGAVNIDIPVTVPASAASGKVDVLSVQAVSQTNSLINDTDETKTLVGVIYDFDADGDVDVVDIMQVASRWNTKIGDTTYDATYDTDDDGDIDIVDIMKVAAQWGWHS